jgi:hypothetical protein
VESRGEVSRDEGLDGTLASQKTVQAGPGKQHKVTWRDDVVGNGDGDAGAGADVNGHGRKEEENDDDDDDSM